MLHPIFGIQLGNFPIYQLMMAIGFVTGWILLGKALKQLAVSPYINPHGPSRKSWLPNWKFPLIWWNYSPDISPLWALVSGVHWLVC